MERPPSAERRETGSDAVELNRQAEETLVADDRATISPSQHVEQRLIDLLRTSPLLISHVQRRLKPGPR